MPMDLRPLTLGELLDRAFVLYRRHLLLFVGIMAVPSVVALGVNTLGTFMQYSMSQPMPAAADGADLPQVPGFGAMAVMVGGIFVATIAYLVVYAVSLGATTLAVADIYQGRTSTVAGVYGRMRGRIGRLVWLLAIMSFRAGGLALIGIVTASALMGGMAVFSPVAAVLVFTVALIAVGLGWLFMMLRWGVAVPAALLEDHGARAAIRRSIELTRGRLGRVLLLAVLATIITYAAILLFQGPFIMGIMMAGPDSKSLLWLGLASNVSGAVGTALTGPIMIIGLALLYYDARIREEGLDLQMMMAALDATRAVDPARG